MTSAINETSIIQPAKNVVYLAKKKGTIVHTDATYASEKIAIGISDPAMDMTIISVHKLGGPTYTAALICRIWAPFWDSQ